MNKETIDYGLERYFSNLSEYGKSQAFMFAMSNDENRSALIKASSEFSKMFRFNKGDEE